MSNFSFAVWFSNRAMGLRLGVDLYKYASFLVVSTESANCRWMSSQPLRCFAKSEIHPDAYMGVREIKRCCALNKDAEKLLETAINKLGLSARAYSRVLKSAAPLPISRERKISKRRISPKRSRIGAWIGGCDTVRQTGSS